MTQLNELYKSDDWKTEKHAPLIEVPETIARNEYFRVDVSIGKEVEHPNTVEHHIRWIQLYFLPEGSSTAAHAASFDFTSHGEQADDGGGIYTHPCGAVCLRLDQPGTLLASAYCNIHGLWETSLNLRFTNQ